MHSTSIYHLLITSTLLLYSVIRGGCFTCHNHGNQSQKRYEIPIRYFGKIEPEKEGVRLISWSRRAILGSGVLFLPQTGTSVAETQISIPNLDSLMDLPPITEGCLRIFLCRHGQTENNRLRKVQGARVDPPINQNGIQQAINLGQSLCRVDPTPNLFFSSNLQRAQMTAKIAANEIDPNINVQSLHFLSEVDFGPIADGQPLALAKAGMQATYAAWATGRIDYRPQGGQGESGREVRIV